MRWRVWYRLTDSGKVYRSHKTYESLTQALTAAAVHLSVMTRRKASVPVQYQARRAWRRPAKRKWLP